MVQEVYIEVPYFVCSVSEVYIEVPYMQYLRYIIEVPYLFCAVVVQVSRKIDHSLCKVRRTLITQLHIYITELSR